MKKNVSRIAKYLAVLIGAVIVILIIKIVLIYKNDQYIKWIPPFGFYVGDVHDRGPSPQAEIDPPNSALFIHPVYPADPSDSKVLMGAAHNVFAGRVIEQSGNKETEIGPRTQYQVEVIDNLKGELKGTVVLDMLGGYDKDARLIMIEENDPKTFLLQVGTTYLFATRYNEQEKWYTLIAHPNARKIISIDPKASAADLKTLAESDEKFKTWEVAYPSEILDKADVANNNTKNNFQSLAPEAKATAEARAEAAKASLESSAQTTQ